MEELNNNVINLCKKGDRKAQTHLYTVFYKKVYNTCFRILQNQYEVEDAMQESFIKVFSQLDKYEKGAPFEAWILRIAINTAIDKLRENKPEWVNYEEERIQCKLSAVSPDIRNQLEKDLNQIVTDNKQFVQKMQNENNADLALFYLVKHYEINLRALKFISDKLGNDVEC